VLLSDLTGTIDGVPGRKQDEPLVSATGITLSRARAFKYALDLNQAQQTECFSFAGAARFTFNHHLGRVSAVMRVMSAN